MRWAVAMLAFGCSSDAPPPRWARGLTPLGADAAAQGAAAPAAGITQLTDLERLHIGRTPAGRVLVGWRLGAVWSLTPLEAGGQAGPAELLDHTELVPAIDGAGALRGHIEVAGQSHALGVRDGDEATTWRRRTQAGHTTVLRPDRLVDARDPTLQGVSAALPSAPLAVALDAADVPWALIDARDRSGGMVEVYQWRRGRWSRAGELGPLPGIVRIEARVHPIGAGVVATVCQKGQPQQISLGGAPRLRPLPACGPLVETPDGPALVSATAEGLRLSLHTGSGWVPEGPVLSRFRDVQQLVCAADPEGGVLVAWTERLGWGAGRTLLQPGLPDGLFAARLHDGAWDGWGGLEAPGAVGVGLGASGIPMVAMNTDGEVILGASADPSAAAGMRIWTTAEIMESDPVPPGAATALVLHGDRVELVVGAPQGMSVWNLSAPEAAPPRQLSPPSRKVGQRVSSGPRALLTSSDSAGPTLGADWGGDGSVDRLGAAPQRLLVAEGSLRLLDGTRAALVDDSGAAVLHDPAWAAPRPLPPGTPQALTRDAAGQPVVLVQEDPVPRVWEEGAWTPLSAPPDRGPTVATELARDWQGLVMLRADVSGQLWLDRLDDAAPEQWSVAPGTTDGALAHCGGPCVAPRLHSGGGRVCASWSVIRADGPHPALWCQEALL